jgi:hypothetical protein
MSLVARGSPCSELARLPPTKYSPPTEVNAKATFSAMSIAFSTSADIELNAGEQTGRDLAPVESISESSAYHERSGTGVGGAYGRLSQAPERGTELYRSVESGERGPSTKQLVVALQG